MTESTEQFAVAPGTLPGANEDYTAWAKAYFDRYDSETFFNEAVQYDKDHPVAMA